MSICICVELIDDFILISWDVYWVICVNFGRVKGELYVNLFVKFFFLMGDDFEVYCVVVDERCFGLYDFKMEREFVNDGKCDLVDNEWVVDCIVWWFLN